MQPSFKNMADQLKSGRYDAIELLLEQWNEKQEKFYRLCLAMHGIVPGFTMVQRERMHLKNMNGEIRGFANGYRVRIVKKIATNEEAITSLPHIDDFM